jgi:hypothetical protein
MIGLPNREVSTSAATTTHADANTHLIDVILVAGQRLAGRTFERLA